MPVERRKSKELVDGELSFRCDLSVLFGDENLLNFIHFNYKGGKTKSRC